MFTSFINFYNILLLDYIAPGAIVALIMAFFLARWATRRYALKEAHAHADELQLAGEDRTNFLAWRIGESLEAAEQRVVPVTGFFFTGLMILALTTGLISCSGPKEHKPTPPDHGPKAQEGVGCLPGPSSGPLPCDTAQNRGSVST